jgi:aryl-phospho-beta-D-glucosidase BglC (GH1 family)
MRLTQGLVNNKSHLTKLLSMNMMKFCTRSFLLILIAFHLVSACKEDDNHAAPELTVSETELAFSPEGDTAEVTIVSSDSWVIHNAAAWLQLNVENGKSGSTAVQVIALPNTTGLTRTITLTLDSDNGQARRIKVSQGATLYPSYNTSPKAPDATGMSSTVTELAAKMHLGLNIGNTFEAPGGETGWGSPVITEDFIKFIKQSGFNAVRIPCAWDWHHVDNRQTAHIDENWMNRVKEVVGYCVKNDMYVLLNIHWDGGWLENNCTPAKKDSVNAKQKAYWEQIATAMRDFDEHLLFASANEPNADDATEMGVLLSYHQTFVDAVRSTGGRNTYRTLVLQGSSEWISVETFPVDPTPNRIMFEEHNYTPFQFCALSGDASWGKMFYYWGAGHHSTIEPDRNATWGEEEEHVKYFKRIKEEFIDKGIPVLMGEYGAYRRNGSQYEPQDLATHNDAVDHWITHVTKEAKAQGIVPFWWDTGGALDRANLTVKDQRTIDALMAGSQ